MQNTTEFLEELVHNTTLLPAEHKAASQLLAMITKEDTSKKIDLDVLLAPPAKPSKETIESLSALEIAEGMTYLDHKIFISITGSEFLGQGTVFLPFRYPLLSVRDSPFCAEINSMKEVLSQRGSMVSYTGSPCSACPPQRGTLNCCDCLFPSRFTKILVR